MVFLTAYNPYIPWDTSFLEAGIALILKDIGAAFSVGIFGFAMISGIFIVFRIISSLFS